MSEIPSVTFYIPVVAAPEPVSPYTIWLGSERLAEDLVALLRPQGDPSMEVTVTISARKRPTAPSSNGSRAEP